MIPILILAAGQSSRMNGTDKLLQMAHGKPLLRHVALQALGVCDDVYVALPTKADARLAVLDGLPITPQITPEAAEGMSGTMRSVVAKLPPCPAFMLLLSDLPDITTADMQRIMDARDNHPDYLIWRGGTRAGKPGHPIVFDASLRPAFAKLSGDGGGETLVNPLRDKTHVTILGDRARRDLDTPGDWAAWRSVQQ